MSVKTKKRKKGRRQDKIGLVLTGGGLRCAYTAGALLALAEKYHLTEPYALGAESGSAGNALYYLAHQYGLAKKMWTRYLTDPKFINKTGVHIDYLIDVIFKKKMPLNTRRLSTTGTKYFLPVTNARTGETDYITNTSLFDYYESLRAAKALPIVYGKRVRLGRKSYIDGGMASNIQKLAQKVLSSGVTTLITINCEPTSRAVLSKVFLSAKAYSSSASLRAAMLKDLSVPPGLCPTNLNVRGFCICPSKRISVGTLSGTEVTLTETFNMGYADVAGSGELQTYFSTQPTHETRRRK